MLKKIHLLFILIIILTISACETHTGTNLENYLSNWSKKDGAHGQYYTDFSNFVIVKDFESSNLKHIIKELNESVNFYMYSYFDIDDKYIVNEWEKGKNFIEYELLRVGKIEFKNLILRIENKNKAILIGSNKNNAEEIYKNIFK